MLNNISVIICVCLNLIEPLGTTYQLSHKILDDFAWFWQNVKKKISIFLLRNGKNQNFCRYFLNQRKNNSKAT